MSLYLMGWAYISRRSLSKGRQMLCCLGDNVSHLSEKELFLWFRSTTPGSEERKWFALALRRSLLRRTCTSTLLIELLPIIGILSFDNHLFLSIGELNVSAESLVRWVVKAFQQQLCMGDEYYRRKMTTRCITCAM